MIPTVASSDRVIEVQFRWVERQKENLPELHSHIKRSFDSCVIDSDKVHKDVRDSFDDFASVVEKIELNIVSILEEAAILAEKVLKFIY